jgi:hypothetical protein
VARGWLPPVIGGIPDITTGRPPLSKIGTRFTGTLTAPRSIISALMMEAFCSDLTRPP